MEQLCITDSNIWYFITDDDTLYYSKKGSERKEVADDVYTAIIQAGNTYYVVADGETAILYVEESKGKFKKLIGDSSY